MYAVIETGGKQYRVAPGDVIEVELLDAKEGDEVALGKVLMFADGDQVKIVKMNIDENPGTPGTYGVRAIPTVLAFRSGAVVEQITGAKPKKSFEEMVEKLLA